MFVVFVGHLMGGEGGRVCTCVRRGSGELMRREEREKLEENRLPGSRTW